MNIIVQAQNRDETLVYYPKAKAKKKSFHWRNDSGELDVFEAAGYFNEPYMNLVREQQRDQQGRNYHSTRRSLDAPCSDIMRSNPLIQAPDYHHHHQNLNIIHQKQLKYEDEIKKKSKQQPSSPGGRLASFLNSLFSQTSLKKKNNCKEREDQSPGAGRRRRRSSISHFRITKAAAASSSLPPITPTKSYKELDLAEHHAQAEPCLRDGIYGSGGRNRIKGGNGSSSTTTSHHKSTDTVTVTVTDDDDRIHINSGKMRLMLINDDDDGESDSSSDLFDLPNHDLDLFGTSSSLPVYETTRMDRKRISHAITTI